MASRPPPSTQPDATKSAHTSPSQSERGGSHQLLPHLPSPSKWMNASETLSPFLPMPPTYEPPSPQARLKHHSLSPANSLYNPSFGRSRQPAAGPSTHSSRPQIALANPLIAHHLPYSPHESAAMPSMASGTATTNPLWLEPSPRDTQIRDDPFLGHGRTAPGITSSPARFAFSRLPATSNRQDPRTYGSRTMEETVPRMPSRETRDRTNRYNLTIRQQPLNARACGMGEKDRRLVDPPPIVQLSLTEYDPSSPADVAALKYPYNFLHCALIDNSGSDITETQDLHDPKRMSRRLTGCLMASPFIGTDPAAPTSTVPDARLGCFYIFPDLSCRQTGIYRLRFTLVHVGVEIMPTGSSSNLTVGFVESDPFEVFTPKEFPGMQASNDLVKELKRQGATVNVRKGNEGKSDARSQKRGSSISGEEAGETSQDAAARRRRH